MEIALKAASNEGMGKESLSRKERKRKKALKDDLLYAHAWILLLTSFLTLWIKASSCGENIDELELVAETACKVWEIPDSKGPKWLVSWSLCSYNERTSSFPPRLPFWQLNFVKMCECLGCQRSYLDGSALNPTKLVAFLEPPSSCIDNSELHKIVSSSITE